jgi:hypothetical protein
MALGLFEKVRLQFEPVRLATGRTAADTRGAVSSTGASSAATVRSSLAATDCQVIPGMDVEGVMNVMPAVHSPLEIRLQLNGVTPVLPELVSETKRGGARTSP